MKDLTKVITGPECRLSYFHGWEPVSINDGPKRYGTTVLIPKTDTQTVQAIIGAVNAALEQGAGKFGGKIPNSASLKLPLRDGDTERDDKNYKGCYFLNANSKIAPQIVDKDIKPIVNQEEVYSGCYARVSLIFYAFNVNGNKGVAVSLGNIQKIKDGTPLDGRSTANDDFGGSFDSMGEVHYDFLD